MVEWFYGKEGQQYGPIDEVTLRARIATGEISARDLVWTEGMESWTPLEEIAKLGMSGDFPKTSPSQSPYAPPASGLEGGAYGPAPNLPVTNGLAIASMVCGILSLVFFCLCGGLFFGFPAVICGHMGMNQMKEPANTQQGQGMALAGLICGYIGIAIFILLMLPNIVTAYRY